MTPSAAHLLDVTFDRGVVPVCAARRDLWLTRELFRPIPPAQPPKNGSLVAETLGVPVRSVSVFLSPFAETCDAGRPSLAPRARAAARPASVRSRIISRSNSATAIKI